MPVPRQLHGDRGSAAEARLRATRVTSLSGAPVLQLPRAGPDQARRGEVTTDLARGRTEARLSGTGDEVGGADISLCVGQAHGATGVDVYPTFKAIGPRAHRPGLDLTPNQLGHAYLACLFEHPERAAVSTRADPNGIPPDTVAPLITLHASRQQRVLRRHGLRIVVATDEDAKVTVRGAIALPTARASSASGRLGEAAGGGHAGRDEAASDQARPCEACAAPGLLPGAPRAHRGRGHGCGGERPA